MVDKLTADQSHAAGDAPQPFHRESRRSFAGEERLARSQSLEVLSQGVDEGNRTASPWQRREEAWRRRKAAAAAGLSKEEQEAASALHAILGAALVVAMADGSTSPDEAKEIQGALMNATGGSLDANVVREAVASWVDALRRDGQASCVRQVGDTLRGLDARYEAFQIAAGVALVDGDLSAGEAAALSALGRALGIAPHEAEALFDGVSEWMG